jgi:O-antigen/teichoic acid export membrane protein
MGKSIEKQNLSKIAIKNSSYSLASTFIIKIASLIFTIIIARLLLPELFGIYSLALSIVVILVAFTSLGLETTLLRYVSEFFGKKKFPELRSYFKYLLKIKGILIFLFILVVICLSKFISYSIYDKPLLFYPLLFSSLYILVESLKSFFGVIPVAATKLKPLPVFNLIEQIAKISFAILAIFLLNDNFKVPGIFLAFALASFIHLLFVFLFSYKLDKRIFFGKTVSIDKKKVLSFFGFVSITTISLVIFTSIDTLMLGKFVDAEYLGYYRAALGLVLTLSSLFSLSNVLFPIFTQINKQRLERGFQKTFRYLMLFSIPATLGMIFISKYLIFTIYGNAYLPAALPLLFLSFLIIIDPFINFYITLLQSKNKPKIISVAILISLVLNVILNYISIRFLLKSGPEYAIAGVALSTVLSRLLLLGILALVTKRNFSLRIKGIGIKKPIFATLIMSLFLLFFNKIVNMNLFFGIIEVLGGILIYFVVLIIIKGVTKEDWDLLRSLVKE